MYLLLFLHLLFQDTLELFELFALFAVYDIVVAAVLLRLKLVPMKLTLLLIKLLLSSSSLLLLLLLLLSLSSSQHNWVPTERCRKTV